MPRKIKNKLNIYLIKPTYTIENEILKDSNSLTQEIIIKDDVELGKFYYGDSHNYEPSWIRKFFKDNFDNNSSEKYHKLFTATTKGILLKKVVVSVGVNRIFAVTFGYGYNLLNDDAIEERFGLKTALNIIKPDSLRKISKKNLSSLPKETNEQLSKSSDASAFGIDIEQDLVLSVTGEAREETFGKIVSGKDSLSVSVAVDIENLDVFLQQCYDKYQSNDYRQNFDWIDQIQETRDIAVLNRLTATLLEKIQAKDFSKTWLAVPEIIDWISLRGFSFEKNPTDFDDDLHLSEFFESLTQEEKHNLDLNILKQKRVFGFNDNNDEAIYQWSIFRCLNTEITEDNNTFILSSGKWFNIAPEFAQMVDAEYQRIVSNAPATPLPKCEHDQHEGKYNKAIETIDNNYCCMDAKNISYGGGRSKIEFCDLFHKDGKIFHIKNYSGSQSLSHLFAQGVVSGELLLSDSEFRRKVNEKLPESHKIKDPMATPNPKHHDIIFGVISSQLDGLDIPFFSRVSIRNAKRKLNTFGYTVYLQKIQKAAQSTQ